MAAIDMIATRKIFVTGAAGMIGSNLVRDLLSRDEIVIGVDNFWRGRRENIQAYFSNDNFTFYESDLTLDTNWCLDMNSNDILIHVADIVAGIGYVFGNEWRVFQENVKINSAIAVATERQKPSKLIYLGTACSYPQQLQRSVEDSVLREEDKYPADPESGYGWSKLIGEIEFQLVVQKLHTRLITLDLHNVYGWPCVYNDATSQVIPALINRAIESESGELDVWGDGTQGRAFLHVSDVVSAIAAAIDYEGDLANFMIGPSKCTTIQHVAELLANNQDLPIERINYDKDKPTGDIGRYADASQAKEHLKWEPTSDLDFEIARLVEAIINDRK